MSASQTGATFFKVVQTRNKSGGCDLCVVPSAWESNKILKWPNLLTKKITKIISDPLSTPESDWREIHCELKRSNLATYELAEKEVAVMMANSDTADSSSNELEHDMKRMPPPSTKVRKKRVCVLTNRTISADHSRSDHNNEMDTIVAPKLTVSSTLFCFIFSKTKRN